MNKFCMFGLLTLELNLKLFLFLHSEWLFHENWTLSLLGHLLPIFLHTRLGEYVSIYSDKIIMIILKYFLNFILIINNVRDKTQGLIKGRESSFMADL